MLENTALGPGTKLPHIQGHICLSRDVLAHILCEGIGPLQLGVVLVLLLLFIREVRYDTPQCVHYIPIICTAHILIFHTFSKYNKTRDFKMCMFVSQYFRV